MNLVMIGFGYSAQAFAAQQGHGFSRMTGTVRSSEKAVRLAGGPCEILVFDGASASSALLDRIADADAILVSVPPSDRDPALDHLGTAMACAPRLRWIGYLSTVGVYGDHGGAWVDENTPCKPKSVRSVQRVAAEQQWLAFGRDHGKAVHIFRLSGIYGPGRNALVKLRDGTARRLVKPGQVFNRIHVDDIAGALAASIARPQAGRIYNVTDDEPAPPQDVVSFGADLLGISPPPDTPFDPAELAPMTASFYGENKRVSNRRIKHELDYRFGYPTYREGLSALADPGQAA